MPSLGTIRAKFGKALSVSRGKNQPPRRKGAYGYVRAAIAYADLRAPEVAQALGVSTTTVSRWQGNGKPPDPEQQRRLAELCGVPLAFLQHGFPAETPHGTEWLEGELLELRRQMADLTDLVNQLARPA